MQDSTPLSPSQEHSALIADLRRSGLLTQPDLGTPLDHEGLSIRQPSPVVRMSTYEGKLLGIVTEAPGTPFEPLLALGLVPQRLDRRYITPEIERRFAPGLERLGRLTPEEREAQHRAYLKRSLRFFRDHSADSFETFEERQEIRDMRASFVAQLREERTEKLGLRLLERAQALSSKIDRGKRDEDVRVLHRERPDLSASQIGQAFGLSSRSVRSIIAA